MRPDCVRVKTRGWCWSLLALGAAVAVPLGASPTELPEAVQGQSASAAGHDNGIPLYLGSGMKAPKLIEKDCLSAPIQVPHDPDEPVVRSVTLKITVRTDGTSGPVEIFGAPLLPGAAAAIRETVARCRWKPGLDASGAKQAMYVLLPVRLGTKAD